MSHHHERDERADGRDGEHTLPTADHPLHGEPRPKVVPVLAVVGLVVVVAVVFAVLTWVRYTT